MSQIADNLGVVRRQIYLASTKRGNESKDVTLVAVSKGQTVARIYEAYDYGVRVFGENRVQELMEKIPLLPSSIEWHMIGHLQRNKVKQIVGRVTLIHSVDSLRLAEEINKVATMQGVVQDILVEVNISGEESKLGITAGETSELVTQISAFPGIRLCGLMTIAPYTENGEDNRLYFTKLSQLLVDIKTKNRDNEAMQNFTMLSMGMTGDYTVAIEEGAGLVRIGTAIFG
ncbi:MAG: YggS family pyridoxal phosphate-dependent enzyme [Lachnospiraceae bacterium]|jgi:pyridoxal phosphate enzyme (YggS family)|nr:YggS family pyridoxal phosphate-dependent enzyme [Lachnospiraceae bacterium]